MLTPFSLKNRINKARSGSPGLGGAIFLRFEVNARGSTLKDCENNFGSPGEDWLSFCFLHPVTPVSINPRPTMMAMMVFMGLRGWSLFFGNLVQRVIRRVVKQRLAGGRTHTR